MYQRGSVAWKLMLQSEFAAGTGAPPWPSCRIRNRDDWRLLLGQATPFLADDGQPPRKAHTVLVRAGSRNTVWRAEE